MLHRIGCFRLFVMMLMVIMASALITSMPVSNAKIGYDINVEVGDNNSTSTWSRSQSTAILSCNLEGEASGNGTYSKRVRLSGFAGQGMSENTYAKKGNIVDQNIIQAMSDENWIHIEQTASNDTLERYDVFINESLPTVLYNEDDLYYRGEGIRTRNSYISDKDKIYTSYEAQRLLKSTRYGSVYSDSLIYANVTPYRTEELILTNRTTAFTLSSDSDKYTGLGIGNYLDDKYDIEQDYYGSFTVNQKITSRYGYNVSDTDNPWLCAILSGWCNDTWSGVDESCMIQP